MYPVETKDPRNTLATANEHTTLSEVCQAEWVKVGGLTIYKEATGDYLVVGKVSQKLTASTTIENAQKFTKTQAPKEPEAEVA